MWFLSCDGDHLGGKQLWLRPGSVHLFGRRHDKPNGEQFHPITHKSVSRQHFTLSVAEVEPNSSSHVHQKSKLTISDLGSKVGTFVDSNKLDKEGSKVLSSNSHVIRLGQYENLFHVKWRPTVLSFSSIPRSARQAADPLANQRARLESLDIKCISEVIAKGTTHVVNKKRNTASCLQALVLGRFIVTEDYIDAIVSVATRPNLPGDTVQVSKLEQDFAANWPPELDYLPPAGSEPNARPAHDPVFMPLEKRSEMFSKFVFVFVSNSQFDTFLPVITGGSGKAVLKELPAPKDSPNLNDFLDFVKSCAGRKGDTVFRLSQHPAEKGGVIVVRPPDPAKIAGADFFHQLDLALDQRSVEQNEFLDAILDANAASLRRALEVEMVDEADEPDIASKSQRSPETSSIGRHEERPAPEEQRPPTVSPVKRKGKRNFMTQKLTKFDDFDPSQIVKYSPPPSEEPASWRDSGPVDSDDEPDRAAKSQEAALQRSRKRPAESQLQPVESTEQVLDNLFTGAAMMKKRKLEEASRGRSVFEAPGNSDIGTTRGKHTKSEQEQDEEVQRIMRERRQEQELRRQQDEESLRTALDGMNVHEMRNLAQIEEMDIEPRIDSGADVDPRWKPEWNGRANWKKFKKRRPGQDPDEPAPARRRVIVPLEAYDPHSVKDNDFWLEPAGESQPASSKTLSQATRTGDDSHDTVAVRRRIAQSRLNDEREDDVSILLPEEVGGTPRDPALRAQLEPEASSGMSSLGRSIFDRGKKTTAAKAAPAKAAPAKATSSIPAKRGRPAPARNDDDDDDEEDGLRFRRRRR